MTAHAYASDRLDVVAPLAEVAVYRPGGELDGVCCPRPDERERGGSCCRPHQPDWTSRFARQGQLTLRSERVGENAFLDAVWPVRGETQFDATAVGMPNDRRPSDAATIQRCREAIQDVTEAPTFQS